jgi:hypothetical protein
LDEKTDVITNSKIRVDKISRKNTKTKRLFEKKRRVVQ